VKGKGKELNREGKNRRNDRKKKKKKGSTGGEKGKGREGKKGTLWIRFPRKKIPVANM